LSVGKVLVDITMSLDGFVAGPNPTLEEPLGRSGEQLHEWAIESAAWRERHGREGGEANEDSEVIKEALDAVGAHVMGRKMFSGGSGPWEEDPNANGWWGDEPPFRAPVYVLTHHAREPEQMEGGTAFHFVNDGVEEAVTLAQEAAGNRDVAIAGGADVIQQALSAGLVDELQVHVAPLLLGGGTRLFGESGEPIKLEATRVLSSPRVAHLRFRVPS
jgi:dihydrofolate reductase